MNEQFHTPTALFIAEENVYGIVYHPANQNAKDLCAIAGVVKMPEDRMPFVRRFFQVLAPNGRPLPFPKGFKIPQPEQRLVDQEV